MNIKNYIVSFFVFPLILSPCSNSTDNALKKFCTQNFVGDLKTGYNPLDYKVDIPDSLDVFVPDERELKNVFEGEFDVPELYIAHSPADSSSITLGVGEKIIDYDVSPSGPVVAALISSADGYKLKLWNICEDSFNDEMDFNDGLIPKSVTWHPQAKAIFIIAVKNSQSYILRLEKSKTGWKSEKIFSTNSKLRRLVPCPRPFIITYDNKSGKSIFSYRLFFGIQKKDNTYRIASITEYGKKFYQVIGPSSTFTRCQEEYMDPSYMEANWALPIAFHPSGGELIWNDAEGNFFTAKYNSRVWGKYKPLLNNCIKGGSITPTPNGLGLIHWQKSKPGIGLFLLATKKEEQFASGFQFLSTPSSVPDGKGIIGLIKSNDCYSLKFIPIKYPQSDVVNAWMFSENESDINLFERNYGLFRVLDYDQLYQLYDSENYYCSSYDQSSSARPYLVTTDIFWELFGSAFQGLFTIKERNQAIPAFWSFVSKADSYYKKHDTSSPWAPVFDALECIQNRNKNNPETNRILSSQTECYSETLKDKFDYSQLKPQGFYISSIQLQEYFKAFTYLTKVYRKDKSIVRQLNLLPSEIKKPALEWINSYSSFISPSRTENVFIPEKEFPKYIQYPDTGLSVFPLSWGFDNEVLISTVYHRNYPKEKQIVSTDGGYRLVPSCLDLAAALSNGFANTLLEDEYKKYPNLRKVIDNLRRNYSSDGKGSSNNLYDSWINALSQQWIDTLNLPDNEPGNNIWQAKRLQTGLASWATLRHSTVLVNETGVAECGEGGFEAILMEAPRGYVEPDPYTFKAIAELFETAIGFVPKITASSHDIESSENANSVSLYDGIVKRMSETAKKLRMFQLIAEKEKKGEKISNDEYEEILHVGRVAEHYFLIFKSLANEEYALSNPDPMPKITNVFGDKKFGYLMTAVGRPLEWDFTVPFFGRKQIVKGAIYSYFEFTSYKLLNDKEWLNMLNSQKFLPWIEPFISRQILTYPPQSGY